MQRVYRVTGLVAGAISIIACTHSPAAGQRIDDVCRLEKNGQRVVASGYFQASILVGCEKTDCTFQLSARRKEPYGLSIRIPLGVGPGTMTPLKQPKNAPSVAFQVERVNPQVRDASGANLSVGDVVKVEGTLEAYLSGGKLRCTVKVARIEAI